MQSGWGWRVLQEVRVLTRRITRREEPAVSIGVMKLAMLLVWLMMGFGLLLAIALPVYPQGGGLDAYGCKTTERPSFCPNEPKKVESLVFQEFGHCYCLKSCRLWLIFSPNAKRIFLFVAILQGFPLSIRSKVRGEIPAIRASYILLNILATRIFLTLFG